MVKVRAVDKELAHIRTYDLEGCIEYDSSVITEGRRKSQDNNT